MSTSGTEKTMSVLHEENKAQATKASNARWSNFKTQSKIVALAVLIVGGIWLLRSPDSPAEVTAFKSQPTSAPVAPKVIPELCQDANGGELPQCNVVMLTATDMRKTLPALACYAFNPGGRAAVRDEIDADGNETGDVLITSKSGKPAPIGLYKVKLGETINGFTCN